MEWAREADQLANGNVEAFDPEKRLLVSANSITWNILSEALEAGREAERAFQEKKASHGLPNRCRKQPRRTRLKMTDPW